VVAAAAYVGYRLVRLLDESGGVDGARTTATLVVLVVSLCTLLVLARPLQGWKLALVATMAGAAVVIVAVSPLGHGIFLLSATPLRVGIAAVIGVGGAILVELAYRTIASTK